MRGVGRCGLGGIPMSDVEPTAAAPATPAAIPVENPRPADLAAAAAAAPVAVPASPGSPAGSAAAATADSKPEAEADWLASMGKRFPPAEKK